MSILGIALALDQIGIVEGPQPLSARDVFRYEPGRGLPPEADTAVLAA